MRELFEIESDSEDAVNLLNGFMGLQNNNKEKCPKVAFMDYIGHA